MSQYRIFAIDPGGHIVDLTPLACSNDEQAIEEAKHLQGDHDLEIWNGERFVVSLRRKHAGYPR